MFCIAELVYLEFVPLLKLQVKKLPRGASNGAECSVSLEVPSLARPRPGPDESEEAPAPGSPLSLPARSRCSSAPSLRGTAPPPPLTPRGTNVNEGQGEVEDKHQTSLAGLWGNQGCTCVSALHFLCKSHPWQIGDARLCHPQPHTRILTLGILYARGVKLFLFLAHVRTSDEFTSFIG